MTSVVHHDDLRAKLIDVASGAADLRDDAELSNHLNSCALCAEELVALEELAAQLDVSGISAAPPADLEQATIAAMLGAPAGTVSSARPASPRRQRRSFRWRPNLAIGIPALVLAFACGFLGLSLRQAETRSDNLQVKLEKLQGKPRLDVLNGASIQTFDTDAPFQDARAQMAITKQGGGVITLHNVPEPPDGHAWQLWQVDKDDNIKSIGIIGKATDLTFLELNDIDEDDLKRIIVTTEPAEGSEQPSSDEVARATV